MYKSESENCFTLLNINQFDKLTKDRMHTTKKTTQRDVRKIRSKLPSSIYSKIYPANSAFNTFLGLQ